VSILTPSSSTGFGIDRRGSGSEEEWRRRLAFFNKRSYIDGKRRQTFAVTFCSWRVVPFTAGTARLTIYHRLIGRSKNLWAVTNFFYRTTFMNLVLLAILWISWCAMHSLLIDASVVDFIKKHASGLIRYYRLFYNGLSLVTLLPLVMMTSMTEGRILFSWEGYGNFPRVVLLVAAFLLFRGGAKKYDLAYFLGIRQLQTGEDHLLLSDTGEFTETGVFGITRHPWYLGSLFLLWSILPRYPLPVVLAAGILSGYLVLGTMLEERKIIARYGDSYLLYRQRVSMLFPCKWLMRLWR
jgi:protein-S-isoprenylcysteine O-methyltransferase Ste14